MAKHTNQRNYHLVPLKHRSRGVYNAAAFGSTASHQHCMGGSENGRQTCHSPPCTQRHVPLLLDKMCVSCGVGSQNMHHQYPADVCCTSCIVARGSHTAQTRKDQRCKIAFSPGSYD